MSRDQNAGHNHNIKNHNESFERVEQFKYFISGNAQTRSNITYRCNAQPSICLATRLLNSGFAQRTNTEAHFQDLRWSLHSEQPIIYIRNFQTGIPRESEEHLQNGQVRTCSATCQLHVTINC
jgi:hypothetical protein